METRPSIRLEGPETVVIRLGEFFEEVGVLLHRAVRSPAEGAGDHEEEAAVPCDQASPCRFAHRGVGCVENGVELKGTAASPWARLGEMSGSSRQCTPGTGAVKSWRRWPVARRGVSARATLCSSVGPACPLHADSGAVSDTLETLQAALADRYGIERELGRGGMATVYLAQDLKHDREVAIKVLHPELAATIGARPVRPRDPDRRQAPAPQHPRAVRLGRGRRPAVLRHAVRLRRVAPRSARPRAQLPLEDAIQYRPRSRRRARLRPQQGIVHRDIKPENILLSGGHALVADFGIARAATEAGSQKLTETGMAVGTPLYMSPEQAVGDAVGPTADLYSLGCVLYEMLAGDPPFSGSNARAIMARHAMEAVPSIQVVRDTVPDEVEDAIMAALSKVVADRPQTAAQFTELLGVPPAPPPAGSPYSRAQLPRRTLQRMSPSGGSPSPCANAPWSEPWSAGASRCCCWAAGSPGTCSGRAPRQRRPGRAAWTRTTSPCCTSRIRALARTSATSPTD